MLNSEPKRTTQDLLTVKQAAMQAHCSESTIKRRIRSGELPAVTFGKEGRKYFIDPDDLARAMVNTKYGKVEKLLATSSYGKVGLTEDERLEAIAKAIAEQAPTLTSERKSRLRELLS